MTKLISPSQFAVQSVRRQLYIHLGFPCKNVEMVVKELEDEVGLEYTSLLELLDETIVKHLNGLADVVEYDKYGDISYRVELMDDVKDEDVVTACEVAAREFWDYISTKYKRQFAKILKQKGKK